MLYHTRITSCAFELNFWFEEKLKKTVLAQPNTKNEQRRENMMRTRFIPTQSQQ